MNFVLEHAGPEDMWVRGEGAWLIDARGHRFLDGRSGVGNVMLGYSRTDIVKAIYRQALDLPFVCLMRSDRAVPVAVDYARALVDAAPAGLTRARFVHTGSAAVEAAILMARSYHRNVGQQEKSLIIGLRNSYHGSTTVAMAASGQPMLHWYFGPMPAGFTHIPGPDPSACSLCLGDAELDSTCVDDLTAQIEQLEPDRIAAVIVEPVNGRSGTPLPGHYLEALRDVCSQNDIILIFDEVFTGFGRMGALFAAELSGVQPDILCLAKGMTSGYSALGAVLATDFIYEAFNTSLTSYFAHASSTDGHPISCAAGMATLAAYEQENVVEQGRQIGRDLCERLSARLKDSPMFESSRATGAFVALNLVDGDGGAAGMLMKRHLEAQCAARGVLIDYTPDTVMLIPPLILNAHEVEILADTVSATVLGLSEAHIDPTTLRPPSLRGHR